MMDAIGGQLVPSNSAAAMAARSPVSQGAPLQIYNPFGDNINTGAYLSSGAQNYLAGAGKASYDLARGAGQLTGQESRQDVANSNALDAPLMATKAGKFGYGTGMLADLAPLAWIPGAGTLAGAAAIGAGTGLIQPSTSTGQTAFNVGLGGLAGPTTILGGRALGAVYQGSKAVLEPLFQGGQQRIAARALQTFAGGPDAAADTVRTILGTGSDFLPGVEPTTAELANNAGISQLTRTMRNNPQYTGAFVARDQANRGAMTSALQGISGNDADMLAAVNSRSDATAGLYAQARDATAPSNSALGSLLQRPSMQSAWQKAQDLAAEAGETIGDLPAAGMNSNPILSGKEIQYLKLAMNDQINKISQQPGGLGSTQLRLTQDTLHSLNDWTQANIPALRLADSTFGTLSKPINQMQIGQTLTNKLLPALADFGGNTRLNSASYAGAVRNGDTLAAQVTGQKNATLESVLNPDQWQTVQQVGQQLARRSNADQLGIGVGSNTAQNVISQNVLEKFLGPFGLSASAIGRAGQSTLGQTILRPATFVTKLAEPRVADILAQSSLDPQFAARLLSAGVSPGQAHMVWARQGLLGPLANSVAFSSQK
jgi:hypothetical protein